MLEHAAFRAYFWTFAALLAAGLGFPIPEELPIVTAGVLVGHDADNSPDHSIVLSCVGLLAAAPNEGWPAAVPWYGVYQSANAQYSGDRRRVLRWWIMLPICICGVVISDSFLYGMGRYFGRRLLERPFMTRLIPPPRQKSIEENFHNYGILVLLFARFLPTIRSPIFIMAGIMRLPFHRFVLADGLYAIPGVSLLFWLAFWGGDQFRDLIERAEGKVEKLRPLLILLVIAAIGGFLFSHFLRHPVATGDPREEVPLVGDKVAEKMETIKDSVVEAPAGESTSGA